MKIRSTTLTTLLVIAFLLAACAPGEPEISAEDAVSTIVAATLTAAEEPLAEEPLAEATPAPAEEDPAEAPSDSYGDCANSGSLSVTYLKADNAWLWVQGGDAVPLTDSGDVASVRISADGCRIAYARQVPNPANDPSDEVVASDTLNELWVVNSDGSDARQLAGVDFFSTLPAPEDAAIGLYRFAWQPGSHTLGFNTQAITFGLAQSSDLHLVDANTSAINTLLAGGMGGDFYFSPDGSQVAFSRDTIVGTINADGSNHRPNMLEFDQVITYSEYLYYPPVHWGPNSADFMVAIPPADGLATPANGVYPETDLWYVPLDGTDPWVAGAIQNVWFAQSQVSFAPDISRIAYLRPLGELAENRAELVAALSNGSNESAQIEETRVTIGAWSPDSEQLLFWHEDAGGRPQIRLLNAADGSVTPRSGLTQFQADVAYFDWPLADAYLQVLYRGADQFIELSLINLDGSGVVIDAYQGSPREVDSAP